MSVKPLSPSNAAAGGRAPDIAADGFCNMEGFGIDPSVLKAFRTLPNIPVIDAMMELAAKRNPDTVKVPGMQCTSGHLQ
jgi:hypothetical protein